MALDRSKRLPPLKSLMGTEDKARARNPETWQEQAQIVRQLDADSAGA